MISFKNPVTGHQRNPGHTTRLMGDYNRTDHFYQKAKDEGLRSRAAFKIEEINKKYKLIKPGMRVLDLGAWPGGWLQVVAGLVGDRGVAVGIDLVKIEDLGEENVKVITGDVRDEENIEKALSLAGGPFDVVISDMSPKLTGVREIDNPACVGCVELSIYVAGQTLKNGGSWIAKIFKGGETDAFVKTIRPLFNKLVRAELDSTRKSSNEFYLIGTGFKPER
jgi:23S rRNA (uridine2552-2'-O)-methyltransferase